MDTRARPLLHSSPKPAIRSGQPRKESAMRGILLWLLGIPIPVIILLWLFHVI